MVLSIFLSLAIVPAGVSSPGIAQRNETPVEDIPPETKPEDRALRQLEVDAPSPFLRGDVALKFDALRQAVIEGAGFDFLAKCGDMMRTGNGRPSKIGTSFNSKHKSGEAFDYNQEDRHVLLVREYENSRISWRTYLVCEKQKEQLCMKANLHTENAGFVSAHVFDFTSVAEQFGWIRIPPQPGWQNEPIKKEFWHYQTRSAMSDPTLKESP